MEVHQFVPGMAPGDAVSNHALEIQSSLKKWGVASEIYSPVQHVSPECRTLCKSYRDFAARNGAEPTLIYHFSIGSELSGFVPHLKGRKVMVYHNITPHTYFLNFSNEKSLAAYAGREQLRELSGSFDLALGDSDFNRKELETLGFKNTAVLPLFTQGRDWGEPAADAESREDGFVNLLFVGRFVPNKKIEDIIKTFFFYQKTIYQKSRLHLVGPTRGFERYKAYLEYLADSLGVENVIFTGRVSDEERNKLYRQADCFLCLSEHEGFCMPLLEAMHFGVPVIGYDAAAVPETLGGAGILVKDKNYPAIAELIHRIVESKELRQSVIDRQYQRLKDFSRDKTEQKLKEYLGIT